MFGQPGEPPRSRHGHVSRRHAARSAKSDAAKALPSQGGPCLPGYVDVARTASADGGSHQLPRTPSSRPLRRVDDNRPGGLSCGPDSSGGRDTTASHERRGGERNQQRTSAMLGLRPTSAPSPGALACRAPHSRQTREHIPHSLEATPILDDSDAMRAPPNCLSGVTRGARRAGRLVADLTRRQIRRVPGMPRGMSRCRNNRAPRFVRRYTAAGDPTV